MHLLWPCLWFAFPNFIVCFSIPSTAWRKPFIYFFYPSYRVKVDRNRSPFLLSAELHWLPDPSHGRGPRSHVCGQQRLYTLTRSERHQQGAAHSKKHPAPTATIEPLAPSSLLSSLSISPCQIHWPVAPQRKNECVLSGKDTNVSVSINGYNIWNGAKKMTFKKGT